jgi:hypothetical protein
MFQERRQAQALVPALREDANLTCIRRRLFICGAFDENMTT